MPFDPIASLWPAAIGVVVAPGELEFEIPELPASVWIEAVLNPDGLAIFPGLVRDPDEFSRAFRAVLRGRITPDQVAKAARDSLAAAAGRNWWEADRLIRGCATESSWPVVHGELTLHGVDLGQISIAAFCDAVYAMCVGKMHKEDDRSKFDWELTRPPAGIDPEEIAASFDMADDFMSALAEDRAKFGGDLALPG
jgi:hypothetical protein